MVDAGPVGVYSSRAPPSTWGSSFCIFLPSLFLFIFSQGALHIMSSTPPWIVRDVEKRVRHFLSGRAVTSGTSPAAEQESPSQEFGRDVLDNVRLVGVELSGVDADEKGQIRVNKGAQAIVVCEYTVGQGESPSPGQDKLEDVNREYGKKQTPDDSPISSL
jgi:hypothetical protein